MSKYIVPLFLAIVSMTSTGVYSQDQKIIEQFKEKSGFYLYNVKVVCGPEEGKILAPGIYWTAVNVLNPNFSEVRVDAYVSVGLPELNMGPFDGPKSGVLEPFRAMELDCPAIQSLGRNEFVKGYALLVSEIPLTVVAVYTQADLDGRASSIHTERVDSIRIGR